MIKEIRLGMADIIDRPIHEYNLLPLLKGRGFPVEGFLSLEVKEGLTWTGFYDYKTDERVVQWEE